MFIEVCVLILVYREIVCSTSPRREPGWPSFSFRNRSVAAAHRFPVVQMYLMLVGSFVTSSVSLVAMLLPFVMSLPLLKVFICIRWFSTTHWESWSWPSMGTCCFYLWKTTMVALHFQVFLHHNFAIVAAFFKPVLKLTVHLLSSLASYMPDYGLLSSRQGAPHNFLQNHKLRAIHWTAIIGQVNIWALPFSLLPLVSTCLIVYAMPHMLYHMLVHTRTNHGMSLLTHLPKQPLLQNLPLRVLTSILSDHFLTLPT